jgi:hypothetical protein
VAYPSSNSSTWIVFAYDKSFEEEVDIFVRSLPGIASSEIVLLRICQCQGSFLMEAG